MKLNRVVLGSLAIVLLTAFGIDQSSFKSKGIKPLKRLIVNSAVLEQERMFPKIIIKSGNEEQTPLGLQELDVKVEVVGDIATTTFEMTFFNNENRILEGELNFPLGDGKTVSRFALDINGKLREGVVVEKEKGRKVFESVVRRNIDPGLLEKTKGNNFKARIYPIPAKGTKKMVFAYEQELTRVNGEQLYFLPLGIDQKVEKFNLSVKVLKQEIKPVLRQNELKNFGFEKWEDQFVAKQSMTNYKPLHQLGFAIPNTQSNTSYTETIHGNTFFYTSVYPELMAKEKQPVLKSTILWDASGSAAKRNLKKEAAILTAYLESIENAQVEVVAFSNSILGNKTFEASDLEEILEFIQSFDFDGGTQLGLIDLSAFPSQEAVLFSDGISNFGASKIKLGHQAVHCITSTNSSDYSYLKYLSNETGGHFFNANTSTKEDIISRLTSEPYRLISVQTKSGGIQDVYPQNQLLSESGLQLGGKLLTESATMTLNFGFGNKVSKSLDVKIEKNNKDLSGKIERLWVQKKLAHLEVFAEKNKKEITDLGKQYGVVTANTSLIILDRVEDYVQHEIQPPKELLQEYTRMINQNKVGVKSKEDEHFNKVKEMFEARVEWWSKDYEVSKLKSAMKEEVQRVDEAVSDSAVAFDGTDGDGSFDQYDRESDVLEGVRIESRARRAPSTPRISRMEIEVDTDEDDIEFEEVTESAEFERSNVQSEQSRRRNYRRSNNHEFLDGEFASMEGSGIEVKAWKSKADYLTVISSLEKEQQWKAYLSLKKNYQNSPSFYVDVSVLFFENGMEKEAMRILSNLSELELENVQLLRILAYQLMEFGKKELSIQVLEEVLKMKGEEPHSYRDLGLAYNLNGEYQKAVEMLYNVPMKVWDGRFPGIETIVLGEINAIKGKHPNEVSLKFMDKELVKEMPTDVRVVLNWDTDNCDMDLWVTDPRGEKCYYRHKSTAIGGMISNDFTGGYGPEEFLLKKGMKGKFKIQANYYGTRSQKLLNPVTLKLQFFTHYGTPDEQVKEVTLRMKEKKAVINIADILFQ